MKLSDFDYELPPDLIAQEPAAERPAARMLVMNRQTGACSFDVFTNFPSYLREGDCLVVNDTRVIPARLFAKRQTGGRVEALLMEEIADGRWHCMMKPGRRLHAGEIVAIDPSADIGLRIVARRDDGTFEVEAVAGEMPDILDRYGSIPLPPYIRRETTSADRERYQTVYAREPGAVAAPTAGLHFTPAILEQVQARGVQTATVTLHVGPGTFKPVQTENITEHKMHEERFALSSQAASLINRTRAAGGRVIAIGTTSVRVLESCVDTARGQVIPQNGRTRLFMHPPMKPLVTDALLTNFHLPRSTLLMLVSTFSTTEHVLAAYRRAVQEQMRFYSYGDCMLLV